MNDNPILTYNNDGVLGTSDDEILVDDAVLSWDSSVVCETDEGEIVGLNDEGGSEVLGLVEPPAVLDWGGVVGGQP